MFDYDIQGMKAHLSVNRDDTEMASILADAFELSPRNPDRQQEAVKLIRGLVKDGIKLAQTPDELSQLSNDIEDGNISDDCYGDFLGVIEIDDMIKALEEELSKGEPYRRFKWALTLLKAIKEDWKEGDLKVITYGH